jgi:hypothetical protein
MRYLVSAMLIVVGIIHLLPVSGALGDAHLTALYGLSFEDPNLEILMRHRAVLFGILGLFFLYSAFNPTMHKAAFTIGIVSIVSFLWLAWSVGGYNQEVARVFLADLVALSCLVVGVVAHIFSNKLDSNESGA